MMKRLFILLVVSSIVNISKAQDVHFSQYFTSPMTLNPAMTGLVNSDFRLAANYRTQWGTISSPYETFTASYDGALLRNQFRNGDAMGIGVMYLHDKSGTGSLINQTVGLSLAYHHALGRTKNQHLSLGIQTYVVNKSIDFSKLTFGDQFNTVTGTIDIPTQERFDVADAGYTDFNTGLMYTGKVTEHATLYGGLSFYHVTRPNETFLNSPNKVNTRYVAYFGGSFELTDYTVAYASALFQQQGPQSEFLIGGAAGFILNPYHDYEDNNKVFYVGAWYRYRDAIIPYIGFELDRVTLGLSFDATLSSLSTANNYQGAYEVSMIFNGFYPRTDKKRHYDFACPKF